MIIAAPMDVKDKIMTDLRWRPINAVRNRRVYVPPQYGGLDGLHAVLGMVWAQGVLLDHGDANARAALAATTQNYYQLFYGHILTPAQVTLLAS